MIKININEVIVTDLDGQKVKVKDFAKIIGNKLFMAAPTIELSDAARVLHAGQTAEVDLLTLKLMIAVLNSNPAVLPFAHLPLMEYLNNKLNQCNQESTK